MGVARKAAADAFITFLWTFTVASLGAVTVAVAPSLGLDGPRAVYVALALVSLHIFFFGFLGDALGGASWNPTASVAFAYAGASDDDLVALAVRVPAQMAGAVGGVAAVLELMPKRYQHTLAGPRVKVPLPTGVLAEAILTFAITLVVMWALLRGPRSPVAKTLVIIVASVALVSAGEPYTGPAMNPANAFGWAFVANQHTSWEHFAVYWAGPMAGSIFAVWAFNLLFGSQPSHAKAKQSKTVKSEDSDGVADKVKAS